ncbi:MAG: hypothetical protein Q8919_04305, partial [Bacteroidota bacterium]|nr:hypothetical protein [Bacteroidota bacterium]
MKSLFLFCTVLTLCCTFGVENSYSQAPNTICQRPSLLSSYALASSGIEFIENKGQLEDKNGNPMPEILYSSDANGLKCYLTSHGLHFIFTRIISGPEPPAKMHRATVGFEPRRIPNPDTIILQRLDMDFIGANKHPRIEAQNAVDAYYNFYLAHCRLHGIHGYRKIIYHDLYPHIDLIIYSTDDVMKYDFIVHPGGEPNKIVMRYSGMDSMNCSPDGKFRIYSLLGSIEEDKPYSYQGSNREVVIPSDFVIADNDLRFTIGNYDRKKDLVIDPPTRQWATYVTGDMGTRIYNVALDSSNNIYTSGFVYSHTVLATAGTYQDTFVVGYGARICKFDQLGKLIWATTYGGRGATYPFGLATDKHRNVVIGGLTTSENGIATPGAHKQFNPLLDGRGDDGDAFLTKFDSTGALLWGAYFGGPEEEDRDNIYQCVAIDHDDNIFLSGGTASDTGIATSGGYQKTLGTQGAGNSMSFLAKFNPSGSLLWGTYYGWNGEGTVQSVTVDPQGNAIITGWTTCTDSIGTAGSFQAVLSNKSPTATWLQEPDGFVARFGGNGNLKWGTYYGGTGFELMYSVCSDPHSNVYIVGGAGFDSYYDPNGLASSGLATTGAFQETMPNDTGAGLIVKFDSSGSRIWSTYFGSTYGRKDIGLFDICEKNGFLFITGESNYPDLLATAGAYQTTFAKVINADTNSNDCAFLEKFTTDGARIWGTYFAGNEWNGAWGVTTDLYGNPLICGFTLSDTGIATAGTYQSAFTYTNSNHVKQENGYLVKFCDLTTPILTATRNPICKGDPDTITLANYNYTSVNWKDGSKPLPWLNNSFQYIIPDTIAAGLHKFNVAITNIAGCDGLSDTLFFVVNPTPKLTLKTADTMCAGTYLVIGDSARGGTPPYTYNWSPVTGISTPTLGVTGAFPNATTTYTESVTDANGCQALAKITIVVNPLPTPLITASGPITFCKGDSVILRLDRKYFSYKWSDGSSSDSLIVRQSGTYYVVAADTNGCIAQSNTILITVPSLHPRITPDSIVSLCSDAVTLHADKGYSRYQWNDGSTADSLVPKSIGKYFVTVADQNGCQGVSDTVTAVLLPISPIVIGPNSACPQSVTSYRAIGRTNDTLSWTLSGGGTITSTTRPDSIEVHWLTSGTWRLTLHQTTPLGCTGDTTITIIVNSTLVPTISPDGNINLCDGDSIVLHAAKGFVAYAWSDGSTADSTIVRTAGSYSVTVRGSGGCTGSSATVFITMTPAPIVTSITANGPLHLCPGSSLQLQANVSDPKTAAKFLWNTGDTTQVITIDQIGIYTVRALNASGCMSTPFSVTIDSSSQVEISGPLSICVGDGPESYSVPFEDSVSYRWIVSNGMITGGQGSHIISVQWNDASTGTGTVTEIDSIFGGCIDTATITITIDSSLHPVITAIGALSFCAGDSVTLDAGSGYATYLWSKDGSVISGAANEFLRTGESGSYSVLVTNSGGCSGSSSTISVTVFPLPSKPIIMQVNDTLFCTTLATSYQWLLNGQAIP